MLFRGVVFVYFVWICFGLVLGWRYLAALLTYFDWVLLFVWFVDFLKLVFWRDWFDRLYVMGLLVGVCWVCDFVLYIMLIWF